MITLTNPDGSAASYNLPVLLVPPGMLQNSQLSMGDPSRLEAVIQKGRAGLPITIAGIGGGITSGAKASTPNHKYLQQFKLALHRMFPLSPIAIVNAGIGSTSSDYGSLRLSNDVMASWRSMRFT